MLLRLLTLCDDLAACGKKCMQLGGVLGPDGAGEDVLIGVIDTG